MSSDRDIHGVNALVRGSALADLLDAPAAPVVRHYQPRSSRPSVCGATEGHATNDTAGGVTCAACRAVLAAQEAKHEELLLRRLAVRPVDLFKVARQTRHRLVGAGLAKVTGAKVEITDKGRERLKEVG